jgi:two-component system chemotaxis response regulator CheY
MNLDDELANEYLAECREHLATLESGLLAMEEQATDADPDLINRVFRAVHSVKGGAGFFELVKLGELAHHLEDVLSLIRHGEMVPTPDRVRVLLRATDRLGELIHNPATSNQADISPALAELASVRSYETTAPPPAPAIERSEQTDRVLRTLLVEDDFASRLLLQTFLSRYGACHVAVNGREAVDAYRSAWEMGQKYDLVCMDIMMPEMDGCEATRQIRAIEASHGVFSSTGARIIMTTTVRDSREVIRAFRELCDAYLTKPIDLGKLLGHMRSYQLIG